MFKFLLDLILNKPKRRYSFTNSDGITTKYNPIDELKFSLIRLENSNQNEPALLFKYENQSYCCILTPNELAMMYMSLKKVIYEEYVINDQTLFKEAEMPKKDKKLAKKESKAQISKAKTKIKTDDGSEETVH